MEWFGSRSLLRKVIVGNLLTPDGITVPKKRLIPILLTSHHVEENFPGPDNSIHSSVLRCRKKGRADGFLEFGGRCLDFCLLTQSGSSQNISL